MSLHLHCSLSGTGAAMNTYMGKWLVYTFTAEAKLRSMWCLLMLHSSTHLVSPTPRSIAEPSDCVLPHGAGAEAVALSPGEADPPERREPGLVLHCSGWCLGPGCRGSVLGDAVLCSTLLPHHLLQHLGLGLGKFSPNIRSLMSISKRRAHLCFGPSPG